MHDVRHERPFESGILRADFFRARRRDECCRLATAARPALTLPGIEPWSALTDEVHRLRRRVVIERFGVNKRHVELGMRRPVVNAPGA